MPSSIRYAPGFCPGGFSATRGARSRNCLSMRWVQRSPGSFTCESAEISSCSAMLHLLGRGDYDVPSVDAVLLGEASRLRGVEPVTGLAEIVDLHTEVMDAVVVGAVGPDVGVLLGLPVEDSDVDRPVGQEHRAVRAAPDLFPSERFLVERGDLVGVLRGQRDVL